MAAARIVAAARFAFADEPAPPETLDVVRRQRQLLRRAAALCLDPIAEEADNLDATRSTSTCVSGAGATTSLPFAAGSSSGGAALLRV
uniref:Uncharacterized protein n=1 Tax=Setaria italica TaxID=4555 RepID=K3Y4C4_SETIT